MIRTDLNVTQPVHIPAFRFFAILAAAAPREPSAADLRKPGGVSACITHDAGVSWPDRRGLSLLNAIVSNGGIVMLAFQTAKDAAACRERITGCRA
jgi:hypothetical protein